MKISRAYVRMRCLFFRQVQKEGGHNGHVRLCMVGRDWSARVTRLSVRPDGVQTVQ